MRCLACNIELSDYESARKNNNGDYIDLCNYCYNSVKDDVVVATNHDTGIVDHGLIDSSINLFVNNYTQSIDND